MLTGARAREIGEMTWSELDMATGRWCLPKERSKNRREHAVVLSSAALDIIRSVSQRPDCEHLFGKRGFTRWSEMKRVLDARLSGEVREWRVHDLRRSAATHMAELGTAPHIIENVLGHYRKSVATTYNRSRYDREVAAALAQWSDYVRGLVEGESNVIPLRA